MKDDSRFPTLRLFSALVAGLLTLAPAASLAQTVNIYDSGGPISPEQAAFDVTFYDLSVEVDVPGHSIEGDATTLARIVAPTRTIVLNLDTLLAIHSVADVSHRRARDVSWTRDGGLVRIDLGRTAAAGETVGVEVTYGGHPRVAPQAPWDGGWVWSTTDTGEPWIATAVQGEGPDVWWPAKDHVSDKPDSMYIHVRVPSGLVVATNGRPTFREDNGDGTTTFHNHVSTPISAYNVALNIAPYEELETEMMSVDGRPFDVTFYALPEDVGKAQVLLPEVVAHLHFFEKYLGPYPFRIDGYKVAQTPHLGMEHQSVIAYGADYDNGSMTGGIDWGFDALHHHELSHEWFGNLVTNGDWKDMWLHEGLGTYMQVLYAEELGGEELMERYLMNEWQMIANETAVAPRESRTSGQIYFDAGGDIYSKGAWVMHMLRGLIGDEAFFRVLHHYTYPTAELEATRDGAQVHFATTDDLVDLAERESGMDLDWFFEVYVRQPSLPRLMAQRDASGVHFRWDAPGGIAFPMPIEVEANGQTTRIPMTDGEGMFTVSPDVEVVVDPHNRVLRENQLGKRMPGQ